MPFANPVAIQDDLLSAVACGQEGHVEYPKLIISRLDAISQCLANVEAAVTSVTSLTISGFEDIFASLSLESLDPPTKPPSAVSPTQWLLDNLHNPYPPPVIKRCMEGSAELGSRTVNEWFTRARQRIGWTRLLRDRFNGCRSAATDAAFRAFVRDDPHSPLDVELYAAFMAVRAHANLVYAPQFPGTPDITPHLSLRSRSPSVTPSTIYSTDSEDSDGNTFQSSRKRKRSCSGLYSEPSEPHLVLSRPCKCRSPPSPIRTSHSLFPLPTSTQDASLSRSRKRRLSESNSDEPAVKKPRCLDWAPRKQKVSDPLPPHTPPFDWESWCTEAFTLPPSATANHPVPDALGFELFNFEAFPAFQPTDLVNSPADTFTEISKQPDARVDSFIAPVRTEKDPLPTSWHDFFNFGLPSQTSPLPSLTNSPSSPDTLWSLSPPELTYFNFLELPPFFDFSSPSLFKIPTLYPVDGVEVVDSNVPLIS